MLFKNREDKAREEAELAEVEQFIQELGALPQFIKVGGTLIHGITGCVVKTSGSEVTLAWVESYAGNDGRVVRLPSSQWKKYLCLMKAQASGWTLERVNFPMENAMNAPQPNEPQHKIVHESTHDAGGGLGIRVSGLVLLTLTLYIWSRWDFVNFSLSLMVFLGCLSFVTAVLGTGFVISGKQFYVAVAKIFLAPEIPE